MEKQELALQKEVNTNQRNKMTEKNYNPQQKEKKSMKKQESVKKIQKKQEIKKSAEKIETKKTEIKKPIEDAKQELKETQQQVKQEIKEEKKLEEKKPEIKKQVKKDKAIVNVFSLPISLKDSKAICRFIKGKRIGDAIRDLKEVQKKKKAVPMKGEIPHRKGMMSGRYPGKASKYFINVLKTLAGNSIQNGIEEPIITQAIPNMASRPFGRFGRTRKKRTHLKIISEKIKEKNKNGRKKSS